MNDIIIRKAKPGDERGVAEMINEGIAKKSFIYIGRNKKMKKEDIEKTRKRFLSKKPDRFTLVVLKNNKIIGSSIIAPKKGRQRHSVEIGWMLNPDFHGQGIGTQLLKKDIEFCKSKGFKKVEAECAIENIASWKLAKKCGFKIEGTKRKALLTDDGRYIDTYIVGRIL